MRPAKQTTTHEELLKQHAEDTNENAELVIKNTALIESIRQISIAGNAFFTNGQNRSAERELVKAIMNATAIARGF